MQHWKTITTIGLAVVWLAAPVSARHQRQRGRSAQPGVFDYYVLSLSWSPQHCATRDASRGEPQCRVPRRYGFVVHGLWPQYETGFPQSCTAGGTIDQAVVDSVLDLMPSPALIRHEWAKHGTCSGTDAATYFSKVRAASAAVEIPAAYRNPQAALRIPVSEIRREFQRANPDVDANDLAIVCSGKFLQEVRVCFDKSLRARDCGRDVRDQCRDPVVTVRPVR